MHRKFFIFSVLLLSGCAPSLVLKQDVPIKEIALCTSYNPGISPQIQYAIDTITAGFITDFNKENHKFKLLGCQNDYRRTLDIKVNGFTPTNPQNQAAGAACSCFGLIAPIALIAAGSPIIVAWYYLPYSNAEADLTLSDDIAERAVVRKVYARSPKYFGSVGFQTAKILESYRKLLKSEFDRLENPAQYLADTTK